MLKTDFNRFDPKATHYSANNALILAEASQLAYASEATIKDAIARVWHTDKATFISRTDPGALIFSGRADTQVFVAGTPQAIIVAFRGTEPNRVSDWKSDFQFRKRRVKVQRPYGQTKQTNSYTFVGVHRGFWRALDIVWDEVIDQIRTLSNGTQSIWLTGHSLGGALASLAAFRLREQTDLSFSGLYTYGQPRVGSWKFSRRFQRHHQAQSFRFVNNNDFVTFVPPFLWGYAHIGQLYYLTIQQTVVKNGLPLPKAILDRIFGLIDFGRLDHNISTYIRIIQNSSS